MSTGAKSPPKAKQRTEQKDITENLSKRPDEQRDSSSSDEDDNEELLREQQRLQKLKERKAAAPEPSKEANSSSSYNADVLFRRHPPTAQRGKGQPVVHNNLLTSKAHGSFMKTFFK